MLQALQIDKIASKFEHVTEQIEEALSQIPYNKLDIPDEVREQVQIFKFDTIYNHSPFIYNII